MSSSRLFALLLLLAVAGCADVVMVSDPVTHPNYIMNDEVYAGRNGQIRVEVAGDTFGVQSEQFAELVVNQMRKGYYRHELFTREASRASDPRYKIVMMFNPDPAVSGHALCAAPQPYQPVPRGPNARTVLLAAFCGGPDAISENMGWVRLAGVDDPKFVELIDQVTMTLFPRRDYRIEGSSGFPG